MKEIVREYWLVEEKSGGIWDAMAGPFYSEPAAKEYFNKINSQSSPAGKYRLVKIEYKQIAITTIFAE
jgi:hypothetical protein